MGTHDNKPNTVLNTNRYDYYDVNVSSDMGVAFDFADTTDGSHDTVNDLIPYPTGVDDPNQILAVKRIEFMFDGAVDLVQSNNGETLTEVVAYIGFFEFDESDSSGSLTTALKEELEQSIAKLSLYIYLPSNSTTIQGQIQTKLHDYVDFENEQEFPFNMAVKFLYNMFAIVADGGDLFDGNEDQLRFRIWYRTKTRSFGGLARILTLFRQVLS